jgi:hypothetical protein
MVLCILVAAWPALAMTTRDCYPKEADTDGDGYALGHPEQVDASRAL